MGRVFHVGSDGDRMVTHVTDVVTTCADGTLRAPFIIKVRGGADGAKKAAAKRKAGEEVRVAEAKESDKKNVVDEGAEDGLTLNIGVGVSPNGSMTLELFHKWIDHFVDHCLLPGQGKGGPPASPPVGLSTHLPFPPPSPSRPSRAANPRPHPHPCPHTHPTYIHTCTCMYTCIHACMYTCIHGMRVYIHTWHACIYMYMHAMYVCMYVYHACTHTHIHP